MLSATHRDLLVSFETALRAYRAEPTVNLRVYYARRLMAWAEEISFSVLDLGLEDLLRWITKGVGPSAETKRSAKSTLSVFYKWALDMGHVAVNPAERIPQLRRPQGVPNPCPDAILAEGFSRCTRPVDVLMLLLGTYQAMRAGEIALLHSADVHGDHLRVIGKGNKTRLVPLHPLVADFIQDFPQGYYFPSTENPSGHMLAASVGKRVRYLLGHRPRRNAHSLRHKFGVDALEKNPDLMALRDIMGHASVATTEIYTSASPKRLKFMVESLPERDDAKAAMRLLHGTA